MLTEEKTRSNAEKMRDKIFELIEEGEKLTIQEKRWVLEEVAKGKITKEMLDLLMRMFGL